MNFGALVAKVGGVLFDCALNAKTKRLIAQKTVLWQVFRTMPIENSQPAAAPYWNELNEEIKRLAEYAKKHNEEEARKLAAHTIVDLRNQLKAAKERRGGV